MQPQIDSDSGAPSREPIVFLAEDDDELRGALAEALRHHAYSVFTAVDGKGLLALLRETSRNEIGMPAVIVTDIRMPRCSGLNVLTALRLAEWDVPVVVITGFGDVHVHADAATLGAAFVLDKPFDTDTLLAVLQLAIRRGGPARVASGDEPTGSW